MVILLAILLQTLPPDAQQISKKADDKLDSLRKAYEKACSEVKAQEVRDLQRIYDAVKKADAGGAELVKAKIDLLSADVAVAAKGFSAVEQWLQGKWICTLGGTGGIVEFNGQKVISGDLGNGKYLISGSTVSIVWDSGYVMTMAVSKDLGDETTGQGRSGKLVYKRMK
jgi:hypothetical protein